MKKTIIAAAVAAAVAAPAAFADVKISGVINQEFADLGNDTNSDSNVDLVISGSEDLGNGMKASFKIHTMYDDGIIGSGTTAGAQADQSISLSGDFGTITTGRFEPMIEGMVVSMAATDAADSISIESAQSSATRSEGGLRYMSPNMNGFQVGIEGFASTETAGTDDFDTTAVYASYSNGGLTVKIADESREGATSASTTVNDTTAIAVQYKMDALTLRVVDQDSDNNAMDETFFGATYAMGANTFGLGVRDSDTATTDGDVTYSVSHALSKRTSVHLVHMAEDQASAEDQTVVGITHKF